MITIKQGMNLMSIFDYRFRDDASYCWRTKNCLWLSSIWVKEEHQRQGVLKGLLRKVKELPEIELVVIPTPSGIVAKAAIKEGFVYTQIPTPELDELMDVVLFKTKNYNEDEVV